MSIFSSLTSQIFGGLLLAGIAYHVFDEISDARKLNSAVSAKNEAVEAKNIVVNNLRISRGNVATLKTSLAQCNANIDEMASVADRVGAAGVAAVREVREAGRAAADRTARSVNAAPALTCEDAEAILRGEAG